MCVDSGEANTAFYISMGQGIEGIKEEVERLEVSDYGSAEDVAEVKALLHYILYEETSEKEYSNGIRDKGRPPGTKLEYFLSHENAKKARLSEAEVVALRFYTTLGYKFMNNPLRSEQRRINENPCPLPVTTAYAEEGIKKLRKLNAPDTGRSITPESPANTKTRQNKITLFRGMRAVKVTEDFLQLGGTELAFMSTTTSLEVRKTIAVELICVVLLCKSLCWSRCHCTLAISVETLPTTQNLVVKTHWVAQASTWHDGACVRGTTCVRASPKFRFCTGVACRDRLV